MAWYSKKYVLSLEERISKLEQEICNWRRENSRLIERLLLKNGVPLAPDAPAEPIDPKTVEKMLSSAALFEDIEEEKEEREHHDIVDTRKDTFDAFAG